MIVVIADDFSGAAELAEAAHSLGLRAEVQLKFEPDSDADVIAVSTDSRSLDPVPAATVVGGVARQALAANPEWIFKKTDSVLRGPVAAEIVAIMEAAGKRRARLVPANPKKGRTIREGRYLIDGKALHESVFADDPEYPRRTSIVEKLVGLPPFGFEIATPDVPNSGMLEALATSLDFETTLAAGGVEFFEALLRREAGLERRVEAGVTDDAGEAGRRLLVCGSQAAWRTGRAVTAELSAIPVWTIRDSLEPIADSLGESRSMMIAIGDARGKPADFAKRLAHLTEQLLARHPVDELLLEGGETAFEVIRRMGWKRFETLTGAEGVGRLRILGETGPELLVKPGSYHWPDAIWPN